MDKQNNAPEGQIWVCPACGRLGKERMRLGDTSCVTWAVLCYEEKNAAGKYVPIAATSSPPPAPEDTRTA